MSPSKAREERKELGMEGICVIGFRGMATPVHYYAKFLIHAKIKYTEL